MNYRNLSQILSTGKKNGQEKYKTEYKTEIKGRQGSNFRKENNTTGGLPWQSSG